MNEQTSEPINPDIVPHRIIQAAITVKEYCKANGVQELMGLRCTDTPWPRADRGLPGVRVADASPVVLALPMMVNSSGWNSYYQGVIQVESKLGGCGERMMEVDLRVQMLGQPDQELVRHLLTPGTQFTMTLKKCE